MTRRQWAWIAAMGVSLVYLLATGKYAYDTGALGARLPGLVEAAAWALAVVAAIGSAVGVVGTVRESSKSFAIRVVNALAGRLAIVGASAVLGTLFLVMAVRTKPPARWTCTVAKTLVAKPDVSRCGDGAFAQLRSYRVTVARAGDAGDAATLRAKSKDRKVWSASIDSDRGGLCASGGPDQPVWGESRLALTADCGADGAYPVTVHVCDAKSGNDGAALGSSVALDVQEGNNAHQIECD